MPASRVLTSCAALLSSLLFSSVLVCGWFARLRWGRDGSPAGPTETGRLQRRDGGRPGMRRRVGEQSRPENETRRETTSTRDKPDERRRGCESMGLFREGKASKNWIERPQPERERQPRRFLELPFSVECDSRQSRHVRWPRASECDSSDRASTYFSLVWALRFNPALSEGLFLSLEVAAHSIAPHWVMHKLLWLLRVTRISLLRVPRSISGRVFASKSLSVICMRVQRATVASVRARLVGPTRERDHPRRV